MLERKFIVNKDVCIIKIVDKKGLEFSCKIDTEDVKRVENLNLFIAPNGYFTCMHNKKQIYLSRYLMLKEVEWEEKLRDKKLVVDHINNDKLDNRKENLRVVTYGQNRVNTNVGELQGVYKSDYGFKVYIGTINLGTYKTYEEAVQVRMIGEYLVYKDCSRLDYNLDLGDINMKNEYVSSKEYNKILDYILENKKVNEIGNLRLNTPIEFEGNDYVYMKDTLKKVKLYEENEQKKIKIIDIKILKDEIKGVIDNDIR